MLTRSWPARISTPGVGSTFPRSRTCSIIHYSYCPSSSSRIVRSFVGSTCSPCFYYPALCGVCGSYHDGRVAWASCRNTRRPIQYRLSARSELLALPPGSGGPFSRAHFPLPTGRPSTLCRYLPLFWRNLPSSPAESRTCLLRFTARISDRRRASYELCGKHSAPPAYRSRILRPHRRWFRRVRPLLNGRSIMWIGILPFVAHAIFSLPSTR